QTYGWAWGFGAAGVGMLLGLVVFVIGKPLLMGRGEAPDAGRLDRRIAGIRFEWLLYVLGFGAVGLVWFMIQHQKLVGGLLGVAGAILVGYVLYIAVFKLPREDRNRMIAAMHLIIGAIRFWALFGQASASLNPFTDRSVHRTILGLEVPASMVQSLHATYRV